jgi:hypothetical protein
MSITKRIEYWRPKNETVVTESGFIYLNTNSVKTREQDLVADSEDALFVEFYELNNSLRYCNGHYYLFVDKQDEKDYDAWKKGLSHARSFNLYYGNGVVD